MSGSDDESSVSGGDKCPVCLDCLKDTYATVDHLDDATTKCHPECMHELFQKSGNSLIARVPVNSYTIYNLDGSATKRIMRDVEPIAQVSMPNLELPQQQNYHPNQYQNPQQDVIVILVQNNIHAPVYDRWKMWNRLNFIICGSVFVIGLILFAALGNGATFSVSSFIALGFSSGALCVGLIIRGVLVCCE
jgi:hypothetical protein